MLRDATLAAFTEILTQNKIPYDYNKAESVMTIKESGSRILFRAVEEFERLRGTNLAWFGLDELTYTQEEAWLRLEARLRDRDATRLCGFAVWTPKGFDWVYRRFIDTPVDGYATILAKPYENVHILEKVPDFYERLKRSYNELFFDQEALGAYLNVNAGAVYKSFLRERNVRALAVNPGLPLLWTLDFNVDPMSSLLAQRQGDEILVLDEIVLKRAGTLEACDEFYSRFPNHQAGLTIYGDASGSRMQTSGTSDYRILGEFLIRNGYKDYRMKVPNRNPSVRERVVLVNAQLLSKYDTVHVYIDPKCKELIKDLEEVTYKLDSGVIDKEKDPNRTHLSDALGYLLWQEWAEQPSYGEQGQRLFY